MGACASAVQPRPDGPQQPPLRPSEEHATLLLSLFNGDSAKLSGTTAVSLVSMLCATAAARGGDDGSEATARERAIAEHELCRELLALLAAADAGGGAAVSALAAWLEQLKKMSGEAVAGAAIVAAVVAARETSGDGGGGGGGGFTASSAVPRT